ncbi:MAG: hypothetical protein ACYCS0_01160 [bacterium]
MKYNSKILQKEVDRLYSLASLIIIFSIFTFGAIGLLIVFLINIFSAFYRQPQQNNHLYIITIVAGLIGLAIGLEKSFRLRLEAQKILCIMSIKKDTELILDFLTSRDEGNKNKTFSYNDNDKFVLESGIKEINDKIDKI